MAAAGSDGRLEFGDLVALLLGTAVLATATRAVLTLAGVRAGMRVLDAGPGGDSVRRLLAEIVGASGDVLTDRHSAGPLDAVVARFGNADLSAAGRAEALHDRLAPGGLFLVLEHDLSGLRSVPVTPLLRRVARLVAAGFDAVGADRGLGPQLDSFLLGLGGPPHVLGVQSYVPACDRAGPDVVVALVRRLLPALERHGLATADELGLDTLAVRLADELTDRDAVLVAPTVIGGWVRRT